VAAVKRGGVKLAETAADAKEKAKAILGMDIKGHTVHAEVMIAQAAPIAAEYYMAILFYDVRANRNFLVIGICSWRHGDRRGCPLKLQKN
jgi:succinyl-CoA synthetase beta subunit